MVKYELATVEGYDTVFCTNIDILTDLLAELIPKLPEFNKRAEDIESSDDQSELKIWGNRSKSLRLWLISWFLNRGWEPFSSFENTYSFRIIVEQT